MKYSPKITERVENLKAMHNFIISEVNDEELIFWWLTEGVPDCPHESDFAFIAGSDTDYQECKELYEKIVKMAEDGE